MKCCGVTVRMTTDDGVVLWMCAGGSHIEDLLN